MSEIVATSSGQGWSVRSNPKFRKWTVRAWAAVKSPERTAGLLLSGLMGRGLVHAEALTWLLGGREGLSLDSRDISPGLAAAWADDFPLATPGHFLPRLESILSHLGHSLGSESVLNSLPATHIERPFANNHAAAIPARIETRNAAKCG
jgi:hypothetical protein